MIAFEKDQDFLTQQESLTYSAKDASRLSDIRYRGGASSYLEVLDSNTRTYSAELTLSGAIFPVLGILLLNVLPLFIVLQILITLRAFQLLGIKGPGNRTNRIVNRMTANPKL